MIEKTLAIVKPDGVRKNLIGEVIRRFEMEGLRVRAIKMVHLSSDHAGEFYKVHRDKHFYDDVVDFMSSGPVVAIVLEGEGAISRVREIMGATNPEDATEGTIRKEYGSDVQENIVHGSDSPSTAKTEIGFFFGEVEIIK